MGWMDDIMADDAAAVIGDADGFGELVRFYPYVGDPHDITVIVRRGVLKEAGNGFGTQTRVIKVLIPIGIAPAGRPSINPTEDFIELARQVGETPVRLQINAVESQAGGVFTVIVG